MKKLTIIFLCLVTVLAIVSCNQNPKTDPNPSAGADYYYRLTATEEAKRFSFKYAGGENGINPEEGDTISFKYRSSHPVTVLYLRDEKGTSETAFAKKTPIGAYISEADEDGWIEFYFEYPEDKPEGTYPVSGILLELGNYEDGTHDEGKGKFARGDYLDIMDFYFNDTLLTIEQETKITEGKHGIWNNSNGDQVIPSLEVIYL